MILYLWQRTRSRHVVVRYHHGSFPPEEKLPAPATSASSRCSVYSAATPIRPSHNKWDYRTTATDQSTAPATFHIDRGVATLATVQPARLESYGQAAIALESPIDRRSPFQLKRGSARRFVSNSERAWPQPLLLAETEQDNLLEQRPWRNSSGGSSCYSRPSSWYSVADTGEPPARELSCGFGAGPGPTIQADQPIDYRHKALPPLPKQESSRCMPSTVAGKQKIEAPRAVLHL